jgi:hypothetical protein
MRECVKVTTSVSVISVIKVATLNHPRRKRTHLETQNSLIASCGGMGKRRRPKGRPHHTKHESSMYIYVVGLGWSSSKKKVRADHESNQLTPEPSDFVSKTVVDFAKNISHNFLSGTSSHFYIVLLQHETWERKVSLQTKSHREIHGHSHSHKCKVHMERHQFACRCTWRNQKKSKLLQRSASRTIKITREVNSDFPFNTRRPKRSNFKQNISLEIATKVHDRGTTHGLRISRRSPWRSLRVEM